LRVLLADDNPLEGDAELLEPHSLFWMYRSASGSVGETLTLSSFLNNLVTPDYLRSLPSTGAYSLRSSSPHSSSAMHLKVYRQWDSSSCGYHALKNAIIGVLAYTNKKENEEISDSILRLMRSPVHFWLLLYHYQTLILEKAASVRSTAAAKGRKHDVVWMEETIKYGILERNYIEFLHSRDSFIQEIGPEHFTFISDLDYLESDPYDVEHILSLDQCLSATTLAGMSGRPPVKGFVIGVSKSHFIAIIVYLDKSNQLKYIIADSSDYEDQATTPSVALEGDEEPDMDVDEQLGTQRQARSLAPNTRMVINCLMGEESFLSVYLHRITEGFVHQSLIYLVDWDTNEIDASRIQDWHLSASTFFSSFFSKALALGVQHVKAATKGEIRSYCRKLSVHPTVHALLQVMFCENQGGVQAVFCIQACEDPLAALLA